MSPWATQFVIGDSNLQGIRGATIGTEAFLQDQQSKKFDREEPSRIALEWLKLSCRIFIFERRVAAVGG